MLNMMEFPFDEQQCEIIVSSIYPDIIVNVEPSLGFDLKYFTRSREFEIVAAKSEKIVHQVVFSCSHLSTDK